MYDILIILAEPCPHCVFKIKVLFYSYMSHRSPFWSQHFIFHVPVNLQIPIMLKAFYWVHFHTAAQWWRYCSQWLDKVVSWKMLSCVFSQSTSGGENVFTVTCENLTSLSLTIIRLNTKLFVFSSTIQIRQIFVFLFADKIEKKDH